MCVCVTDCCPADVYRHIFKRLKFLGNKVMSQMATLLFLALWHGLHSGYILCFSMEFIIVNVERQVQRGRFVSALFY